MLTSLVPIDATKYMNFISRGLSYDNILSWLGDVNMLYRWHEGYNRAVEQLADVCSLPLFDLRGEFLYTHAFKSLICDDGIHPTAEGHRMTCRSSTVIQTATAVPSTAVTATVAASQTIPSPSVGMRYPPKSYNA